VVVAPVRRARFEGEYQSMRSAACASAPSHPLHVMPPRRTRNSHRPRASDRTMVDLEQQSGLPPSRTRWHRHHPRRKLMSMGNRPSFSREAKLQWAGSREKNLASGRGRTFFLDIPFDRTHRPRRWSSHLFTSTVFAWREVPFSATVGSGESFGLSPEFPS
jgi:hypothetical protein